VGRAIVRMRLRITSLSYAIVFTTACLVLGGIYAVVGPVPWLGLFFVALGLVYLSIVIVVYRRRVAAAKD